MKLRWRRPRQPAGQDVMGPDVTELVASLRHDLTDAIRAMGARIDAIAARLDTPPLPATPRPSTTSAPTAPAAAVTAPAPPPSTDSGTRHTLDEQFAHLVTSFIGSWANRSPAPEDVEATVIGALADGSIAWVNTERRLCGRIPARSPVPVPSEPGARVIARVTIHPWGVETLKATPVPPDRTPPRGVLVPTVTPGDAPSTVTEKWKRDLRPGDIVLTHVSYDGTLPSAQHGRLGKNRPAVFIRWEREYAIVRAIYDEGSYVGDRDLGTPLLDTSALEKRSVVRNAEYDVEATDLLRLLGRLGERDIIAMHLAERRGTPATAAVTPEPRVPATPTGHQSQAPTSSQPEHRRALDALVARLSSSNGAAHEAGVLHELIRGIVGEPALVRQLREGGLSLGLLGYALTNITNARGVPRSKGNFAAKVEAEIGGLQLPGRDALVIESDAHDLPVLRLGEFDTSVEEPVRIGEDIAAGSSCRYVIDDDYLPPDIVIMDQFSSSKIAGSDKRVSLSNERVRLSQGADIPCVVVGSDAVGSWAAFQRAAKSEGWAVEVVNDRPNQVRRIVELAREHHAQVVTLVCTHADVVSELENNGFEVNVISAVE